MPAGLPACPGTRVCEAGPGGQGPALQPSWPCLRPPWGWVMRGGFEREVASAGWRWGRAGVLGTLRPLSLIKAQRCRPTGEVWPHLALIRRRRLAAGSVLAHRSSETGALLADLPPHLVAQQRAKPGTRTTESPAACRTHPQKPCLSRHCPLAQPLWPRQSFPQEDPSTPSVCLSSVPSAASLLTPMKSPAPGGFTPRLPHGLGSGPHPVLRRPCLRDQAGCILPCHTPEGIRGIPPSGHPTPPPKAQLGFCTLGPSSCSAPRSAGFLGLSLHPGNPPSAVPTQCWGLGAPQGREHPQW